jgi:hypothetical protein
MATQHIDNLASEDNLTDSFVHQQAIKLFSFLGECDKSLVTEYTAKLCYWISSHLETSYSGECLFSLLPPWNQTVSNTENKKSEDNAIEKIMQDTLKIILLCSGNLLQPHMESVIYERNGLDFSSFTLLNQGTYGDIHLIDGYAVKVANYKDLDMIFSALLRETTVLAMLGRLRFVGLNDDQYYVGMDYYPHNICYDQPTKTMQQLSKELYTLHSLGVIHCDIKIPNIMTDSLGHARLIDFGSCRFTPAVNASTYIGSDAYRDYLILKHDHTDYSYEIDIWALGIVFYVLENQCVPWDLPKNVTDYAYAIENQWKSVMMKTSSLVQGMLALKKEERWTIEQIVSYL